MASAIPNTQNISKILIDAVADKPNPLFNKDVNVVVLPQVINNVTCHENEPTILIDNARVYDKKPRQESNRAKRLARLTPSFFEEDCEEHEMREALQIMKDAVTAIQWQSNADEYRYMTSWTKGTKRYCLKKKGDIENAIEQIAKENTETFGLTITCNPIVYGNLPYVSWKHFKDDYKSLLKYIREKLHGKYVMVMESTKKGYPHAHLFLAFPKGTIPNFDNLPKRKALKYCWLSKQIKKRIKHPIFNLQKVTGKKTKYYLTKYIAKAATMNIFALANKKEEWTDEEKKAALCQIYTTITKTRQFVLPQKRKPKQSIDATCGNVSTSGNGCASNEVNATEREGVAKSDLTSTREGLDPARLRAYLIRLCTNFPCYFKNDVRIMSTKKFETLFQVPIEEMQKQNDEVHERFKLHSNCLTCGGCFDSHLARFLVNGKDEWFDNVLWFENGMCELAFSDEVKQNENLFMHRLAWWTEYALSNFHLANCKISEFFKNQNIQLALWARIKLLERATSEIEKMTILKMSNNQILKIVTDGEWFE